MLTFVEFPLCECIILNQRENRFFFFLVLMPSSVYTHLLSIVDSPFASLPKFIPSISQAIFYYRVFVSGALWSPTIWMVLSGLGLAIEALRAFMYSLLSQHSCFLFFLPAIFSTPLELLLLLISFTYHKIYSFEVYNFSGF